MVHSPKTEHHEGHQKRVVPLFPELRAELERHFSLDETKGNEFVIEHFQNTSWQLHTQFQTIAKRADLGTILRPFDNMRIEVRKRWGQVLESLWIGHSERVMKDLYALVSDDEFAEAAGATEADLENPIPHAHDHAKPTVNDSL